MKEAIIIGLDGFITDVILVEDTVTGVSPIYVFTPVELVEGKEPQEPIQELVGYQIAMRVPEGLFVPKFDIGLETWFESKPQAEIDAIKNAPVPVPALDILGIKLVENDLAILNLQANSDFLGQQVVANDLRILVLEGGVPL